MIQSRIRKSESRIREAEANLSRLKTLIDYTRIRAPFRGIVTERFVDPGALIQQGTASGNIRPIVTVARIDPVRLFVEVPENDVPLVDIGDTARVRFDAFPGREFQGQVDRMSRTLNPSSRTMKTQINLPNPKQLLKPGMFAKVRLLLEQRPDALTVPSTAVHSQGRQQFVYVVEGGLIRKAQVETRFDDGIRVEVTAGLSGSEDVVASASGTLAEGIKIDPQAIVKGGR
ncbi:MAG: efflux RND transporter periplasmic adaptor subunit [Acidobacteriota bacterium]